MSNEPRYFNRSPQVLLVALACLLTGANGAAADLNDGPIAYWSFDEGEGDIAHDYSGNNNDGTIHGATWTDGVSGSALDFDGMSAYVDCGNFQVLAGSAELTMCLWMYPRVFPDPPGDNDGIFMQFDDYDHQYGIRFDGSGDRLAGYVEDAGIACCALVFYSELTENTWYHVVYTFSGSCSTLYLDAELRHTRPNCEVSALPDLNNNLVIGSMLAGSSQVFNGIIDEVRIYDRALSQDEIQQLGWAAFPNQPQENTEGDQSDVSGTSKDPVNTATGSFFHQKTDLSIPSRGMPLTFTRFYNSKAAAPGRKAAKPKQSPPARKTATSQPASAKDGERVSIDAEKHDESPAGKDQKQAAGNSSRTDKEDHNRCNANVEKEFPFRKKDIRDAS